MLKRGSDFLFEISGVRDNRSRDNERMRVDCIYIYISWGERNTAVTTYFGENEFFTKMNTIFNVTDSDKFLKLLYK